MRETRQDARGRSLPDRLRAAVETTLGDTVSRLLLAHTLAQPAGVGCNWRQIEAASCIEDLSNHHARLSACRMQFSLSMPCYATSTEHTVSSTLSSRREVGGGEGCQHWAVSARAERARAHQMMVGLSIMPGIHTRGEM